VKMAKHVPVAGANTTQLRYQPHPAKSISRPQPALARIVVQSDAVGTRATDWPVLNVLHRRLLAIAEECPFGF